eukprot:c14657_g1_i3.p1 GENE.c14657_g1_i3~~c14657_g1_i3.p1  ORF type:complete len:215 (+),score=40.62 c14657_g1_i3:32-646(+)
MDLPTGYEQLPEHHSRKAEKRQRTSEYDGLSSDPDEMLVAEEEELRRKRHQIFEHQRRLKFRTLADRIRDLIPPNYLTLGQDTSRASAVPSTISVLVSSVHYIHDLQIRLSEAGITDLVTPEGLAGAPHIEQMVSLSPQVQPVFPNPTLSFTQSSHMTPESQNAALMLKRLSRVAGIPDTAPRPTQANELLNSLSQALKPKSVI